MSTEEFAKLRAEMEHHRTTALVLAERLQYHIRENADYDECKAENKRLKTRILAIVDQLQAVLCEPDGTCCIAGSAEDRTIINKALDELETLCGRDKL